MDFLIKGFDVAVCMIQFCLINYIVDWLNYGTIVREPTGSEQCCVLRSAVVVAGKYFQFPSVLWYLWLDERKDLKGKLTNRRFT